MDTECSICYEIVRSTDTQNPFATLCGHIFHENCIKECFKRQNKCPQCNQPQMESQLIRLFMNEPEDSVRAKDELIEQLTKELNDLNEKAQLQYDLIGSLNRQIDLEKKLSHKEKEKVSQQPSFCTSNVLNFSPISKPNPPKPNFKKRSYFGDAPRGTATNTQTTFGSNWVVGNNKEKRGKALFNYGGMNSASFETQNSCGYTLPKSRSDSGNILGFGNNSKKPFMVKEFSNIKSAFDKESGLIPPLIRSASLSQTGNYFTPTASEPILNSKSPSSTISTSNSRSLSSTSFFHNWRERYDNSQQSQSMDDMFTSVVRAEALRRSANRTSVVDNETFKFVFLEKED